MCGIAGFWTDRSVDQALLERMGKALVHRGPDDGGHWSDDATGIGFAHRRLAIIDLSPAGHQPMSSSSGRFMLAFNGEIYNHAELRALVDPGGSIDWRGHSDTETLLAVIERFGLDEALRQSTGMFAMALWDRKTRTLSLTRDRLGEKPLYYGWTNGIFLFASELKAMRAVPGFDPTVDRSALDALLRYLAIPAPQTIYRDIFKLLPGSILTLGMNHRSGVPSGFDGRHGPLLRSYWSIARTIGARAVPASDTGAQEELERLLVQSIERQSVADVPVGTFLSGGYDSSMIAALQQAHCGSRVATFTIGFEEAGFDEAPQARAVAKHLGTSHHEMRVSAADALALIPELPVIYDEPFADSSQIPTTLLSRLARRHVTVALSGDGGDELFGGYNRYLAFAQSQRVLGALPLSIRRSVAGLLSALGIDRINRLAQLTGVDRRFPQPGQKSQKLATLLMHGGDLGRLYSALIAQWPTDARPVLGIDPVFPLLPDYLELDELSRMMAWDMENYLPNDVLVKVDRASMSSSLETRAPFLDRDVVDFALNVPSAMKIGPEGGKAIMRRILYRHVPRELLDRPKAGFAIPLGYWLRGPLRDWVEDLFAHDKLADFFDVALIRQYWAAHLSGRRDHSQALWPVLMFQAWR